MKRIRSRLTYSNVVASVALFGVLGGGAYAAAKIDTDDLKDEAVTKPKIEKRTITGNRIAGNTIEGKKIDELTLGQVPSAAAATDAQTLQGNGPGAFVPETSQRRWNFTLGFGESREVFTAGTLTVTAQCLQNTTDNNGTASSDVARLVIATNTNGAVFSGNDTKDGTDAADFLNTDTPEGDRILDEQTVATGTTDWNTNGTFGARDPNGVVFLGADDHAASTIGLFGSNCTFAGVAHVLTT